MQSGTSLCKVCIGCGRCAAQHGLQVITDSFLKAELLPTGISVGKGSFVIADIGTTTIAMELYDEDGRKLDQFVQPNPQRVFGTDVVSRIQAAESPLVAKQMQSFVKGVLVQGVERFRAIASDIKNMYLAGNTTMMYCLLGHNPEELGHAPFQGHFLDGEEVALGEIVAHTMPGLSAFVGGDIVAGVLACGMQEHKEISLFIDFGTNGEMILGNREKLIACSTSAGPAFEGMLQAKGQAVWGADIVKYAAELLDSGILDETGLLAEEYFEEGVTIGGVCITQEHVRELQTAKAAIAAGIQVLISEYGIALADIEHLYLAGGFGYFLEEQAALRIGLLPKAFRGKIQAVGNSALAGCYAYHFDKDAECNITRIKELTRVINLAEAEGFAEEFVKNMDFNNI